VVDIAKILPCDSRHNPVTRKLYKENVSSGLDDGFAFRVRYSTVCWSQLAALGLLPEIFDDDVLPEPGLNSMVAC